MAQVKISRTKTDSNVFDAFNYLNLKENQDTCQSDLCDLTSLLCSDESDKSSLFSISNIWSDCDGDLDAITITESFKNNDGTTESLTLSALAKSHFLSNNISGDGEYSNSSKNSVQSLASFFQAACSEKDHVARLEDETDSGANISQQDASKTIADLFFKTQGESIDFEVNLDICIKSDGHLKRAESISIIQQEESCNFLDLLSGEKHESDTLAAKQSVDHIILTPKAASKPLTSEKVTKLNVKPSLFAKSLSCKRKPDNFLKQKVSDVEQQMSERYLQLTKYRKLHKTQKASNLNLGEISMRDIKGRYSYGVE